MNCFSVFFAVMRATRMLSLNPAGACQENPPRDLIGQTHTRVSPLRRYFTETKQKRNTGDKSKNYTRLVKKPDYFEHP
jgi:hypothetical protein